MSGPFVWSASSVTTYNTCALQWYFTYIEARETPPSEAQAIGTAVRDHVEKILRTDDAENLDPGDHPDAHVNGLVSVFRSDILPTYGNPALIGEPFQIEVSGIPYSGVIGALDKQAMPWGLQSILRDTKTTGRKPSPGRYTFNMYGSFLGATEGLGHEVDGLQLDYIVRAETPYYLPEHIHTPGPNEIDGFAAQLEIVAEDVEQGEFSATGIGSYACAPCPHRKICGPAERYAQQGHPEKKAVYDD